jgi:hypothetical protein
MNGWNCYQHPWTSAERSFDSIQVELSVPSVCERVRIIGLLNIAQMDPESESRHLRPCPDDIPKSRPLPSFRHK